MKQFFILIFCLGVLTRLSAQSLAPARYDSTAFQPIKWMDTIPENMAIKGFFIRRVCKGFGELYPDFGVTVNPIPLTVNPAFATEKKCVPLLQVSGNILYDMNYRSRIDTPYAGNNVYQHTLQTRLNFVYKEQYPFKVYLTTRFSNSSLFRKYTDLTFQYTKTDFERLLKQKLTDAAIAYISARAGSLDSIRRAIQQKRASILGLSQSMPKIDVKQQLVEDREKKLAELELAKLPKDTSWGLSGFDRTSTILSKYKFSKVKDSLMGSVSQNGRAGELFNKAKANKDSLEAKQQKLDTLLAELDKLENLYSKLKSGQQLNLQDLRQGIEGSKNGHELSQKMRQFNLPDSLLPKGYKNLIALQTFSVGRSLVNYSELSVKNISITGVQVEYNPHYYYAFALGKVDYRFRDYIVPSQPRTNQYVGLVRFGKGTRNGNHVIFTYYTGKRQFFNSSIAMQPGGSIPEYHLAGITIEGFYRLNKTTSLVAEVAKSTAPYYSLDSMQKKDWMGSVLKFKSRANEAYSLRLNSFLPRSLTRVTASIKYTGANFQSFSTFTTGASQLRWLVRLEQPFLRKKLTIISSVQKDDYSNPFIATAYKSAAVLASFQANLRIKKWPTLSVGYYPSYQLTKVGDNSYSESRYFTMMGNASYNYKIRSVQFISYVVYSRFFNSASDSGFVYYNSKNLLLSQCASINNLSILFNGSLSANTGYNIYTLENSEQFRISRLVAVGAGVKVIKHSLFNQLQLGYSGNLNLSVPKLGDIQLMLDKGFIPGLNRQLVENKMGRVTYLKTF